MAAGYYSKTESHIEMSRYGFGKDYITHKWDSVGVLSTEKKAIRALAVPAIPAIRFAWLRSFQYDFVVRIHDPANATN